VIYFDTHIHITGHNKYSSDPMDITARGIITEHNDLAFEKFVLPDNLCRGIEVDIDLSGIRYDREKLFNFPWVIAGVHGIKDVEEHHRRLVMACNCSAVDCIAHPYGGVAMIKAISDGLITDSMIDELKTAAHGKAIEINGSCLASKVGEKYGKILKKLLAGHRLICLASDAHNISQLHYYDIAKGFAVSNGFCVMEFCHRKPAKSPWGFKGWYSECSNTYEHFKQYKFCSKCGNKALYWT